MPTTTIRLRLILILVGIIGGGALIQGASFVLQGSDTIQMQSRSLRLLDLGDLAHGLEEAIDGQHGALVAYLLTGDRSEVGAYNDAQVEEAVLIRSSDRLVEGDPEVQAALDGIELAAANWRGWFADPSITLMQAGSADAARTEGRNRQGEGLYRQVAAADEVLDERIVALTKSHIAEMDRVRANQLMLLLVGLLGAVVGTLAAIWLLGRWVDRPLGRLLATARRVEAGENGAFEVQREDEIGKLGRALEGMRVRLFDAAVEASVVNRFTEMTIFVEADGDVARATLDALSELAAPDDGTIHISNRSKDRAVPEGSIGDVSPEMISVGQLDRCPGMRRGGLFVMPDLAGSLSVRCPVYPAVGGTLACLPLVALGEVIGAIHLHWNETDRLPLEMRRPVKRITEHASLLIANRRLMTALQGQASTDGRTGLPNSRNFDEALETCLERSNERKPVSVLMLDIDHFKLFNDRNGHPAGDQALRAFAGILRAATRDVDMAARYGGEEFAVLLPGASTADALVVAERIRARTEEAVVDLSPGHRDQFTVSIGVATWPSDVTERAELLKVADAALYRAKNSGRNRVVAAGSAFVPRGGEDGPPDAEPGPGPDWGSVAPGPDLAQPITLPRAV